MTFVSVRELRSRSAAVWQALDEERHLVVTSNGKPIAVLCATSPETFDDTLAALRQADALRAIESMQRTLAALYTTDAAVIAIAGPAIVVGAIAAVPDGVQGVLMGALRGASDVWPATFLYIFSFWMIMVPLGYWLAVPRGLGATGLMAAVVVGATVAALLLGWRFRVVSARAVRQV